MRMLETENSTRGGMAPQSWQVRRKALLAAIAFVPMLLIVYALGVSIITPGGVLNDGTPLLSSAILISGIGGYVFWSSLNSLARTRAAARGARRVPQRSGRFVA